MMMIVRLYPKTDYTNYTYNINKIWDFVEQKITQGSAQSITPLYATQTEGMMDVGIIFEVKHPDDVAHFLTEEIVKCPEVHHTKTISLMKPVFFPIPKRKPKNVQRYLIRVYMHPSKYKEMYDNLINYPYSSKLFPIYISYSLGDEDLIMSIAADSKDTATRFLEEQIRTFDGVDQSALYPVFKTKRFAPLEQFTKHQKTYLGKQMKNTRIEKINLTID